jgi:hypothetical protein
MTSPDLIPRLASSIQWLESSTPRDPHADALVRLLCETVKLAVWSSQDADVSEAPPTSGHHEESWLDRAKIRTPPGGFFDSDYRTRLDPDDAAMPAVKRLVQLLRQDDPSPDAVADAAGACLVRPPSFVDVVRRRPADEEFSAAARPTVSPLRDFADSADANFGALLATVQQSFPAIPAPAWMWQL